MKKSSSQDIGEYSYKEFLSLTDPLERRRYAGNFYHTLKHLMDGDTINLTTGDPLVLPFKPPLKAAQKYFKHQRDHPIPAYASGPSFPEAEAAEVLAFIKSLGLNSYKSAACILPCAGISHALTLTMECLLPDNFDVVIAHTPNYGLSLETTSVSKNKLCTTPLNPDGTIDPQKFHTFVQQVREDYPERKIMYYLSSPHNPTGDVVPKKTLMAMAKTMRELDLICFHDVAYWGLEHSDERAPLMASVAPERTITGFTCSKLFGLPNQRSGFIVGPENMISPISHHSLVSLFSISDAQKTIAARAYSMDPELAGKRAELIEERRMHYLSHGKVLFALVNGIDSIPEGDREMVMKLLKPSKIKEAPTPSGIGGEIKIDYFPKSGFFALLNVQSLIGTEYEGKPVQCAEHVAYMLLKEANVFFLPGGAMLAENTPAVLRISFSPEIKKMVKGIERVANIISPSNDRTVGA